TASGTVLAASPVLSSISPEFVLAGSPTFSLTVNGSGFNASSTVQLGSNSLPTTFVNANQLTATVDATTVAHLRWAWISVHSPAPGGGSSTTLPLSFYQVVSLDTNHIRYVRLRGRHTQPSPALRHRLLVTALSPLIRLPEASVRR